MTQEQKNLLLQDLCARLPYNVKCQIHDEDYVLSGITYKLFNELYFEELDCKECDGYVNIEYCKPYLFPLSSMTEEQKIECFKGIPLEINKYGDITVKDDFYGNSQYTDLDIYLEVIDWLNRNHFDYRSLIEKGLAIDASGKNIY